MTAKIILLEWDICFYSCCFIVSLFFALCSNYFVIFRKKYWCLHRDVR